MKQLSLQAPVPSWDEAIPLGNGLMGGLMYGSGTELRISLDRGDLWDERPSPLLKREEFTWRHWLELRSQGKWAEIDDCFDKPYAHPTPTKLPGGGLELNLGSEVTSFELDFDTALARAELTKGTVTCFFSAVDAVAMLRIQNSKLVNWRLMAPGVLVEKMGYEPAQTQQTGPERWFLQSSPEGLVYAAVGAEQVSAGETVLAFTITATTTDGNDPLRSGRERVSRALSRGFEAMFKAHKNWWENFWARSQVSLPEQGVQAQYDLVRYLLGAGSRTGAPPMPLQGAWTADDGLPPWKGDYHHDLNTEMMYVSYAAAGDFEQGRVFLDFMWKLLPVFREFASRFYGTAGAMCPPVMSAAGTALCGWPMFALMPQGNGSWVAWMFYRHWCYTCDPEFLKERAYPFCSEFAECIAALLKPGRQGVLRTEMSSSPEIFDNTPAAYLPPNSNYDRDSMEALFNGLNEMAHALGLETQARRWSETARQLNPRWSEPHSGELGFAEGIPFDRSHRHLSHLMSIYPYGQLHVEAGEAERRIIDASVEALERLGPGEWCGYTHTWMACLLGRIGRGDQALRHLQIYEDAFISRNGFHLNCNQKGGPGWGWKWNRPRLFTLEGNFLAMEAVHEMLLQGWGGVVRVFPATPAAWSDLSFRALWAEGGWKVSAEQRDGQVITLEVESTVGGVLRLKSPWPRIYLKGTELEIDEHGIVTVHTEPGLQLAFSSGS